MSTTEKLQLIKSANKFSELKVRNGDLGLAEGQMQICIDAVGWLAARRI